MTADGLKTHPFKNPPSGSWIGEKLTRQFQENDSARYLFERIKTCTPWIDLQVLQENKSLLDQGFDHP